MVRREGFEPPALWSVGCLKAKSESFRLRFVLFTAVRSADFPLFPSSPARFFRILGQKWVRVCERSEAFSQDSLAVWKSSKRRRRRRFDAVKIACFKARCMENTSVRNVFAHKHRINLQASGAAVIQGFLTELEELFTFGIQHISAFCDPADLHGCVGGKGEGAGNEIGFAVAFQQLAGAKVITF